MTIFSNLDMQLTILILLVGVAALLFWLISFPQYILFELTDKGTAGGVKISKRKRRVHFFKELPLFSAAKCRACCGKKSENDFSPA
ncbi:MAG: hypothetical protein CDV28_10845 [Candidatus Electronema aureum]|uniref:Uncharacterized protein n=1 Tax=Candidatus Electronema aureum TaxID=2005002 RepID=A0A521G2Q9_9BACT|nr:MAG: hypothetical protein CDV28_10845 [Candidatus Electronema aureum]